MLMYGATVEVASKQEQAVQRGVTFTATSDVKSGCSPVHAAVRVASGCAKRVERLVQGRTWHAEPEMSPSQHPARINLHDLKAEIVNKIGQEKANQYFSHFKRFISYRLKKPELDRLVISTIGRENVALHNKLIRAVLNNALRGEVPPPPPLAQDISKPVKGIRRKPLIQSVTNGDTSPQNPASLAHSAVLSNGDSLTLSPRKGRSGIRDRKTNKERPSLLGPYGKGEPMVLQGATEDDAGANGGDFRFPDLYRPLQESQSAEEPDSDLNSSPMMPPFKRLRILPCSEATVVGSKEGAELCSEEYEKGIGREEDGEYLLQADRFVSAPLGLPFCPGSVGSARKPPFIGLPAPLMQLLHVGREEEEFLNASDLPDAETVKRRMDHIAGMENLNGVSRECADLVCQALDILLKRLIKSSVDLGGAKASGEQSQLVSKDTGLLWHKETVKDACFSSLKLHQGLNGVLSGNCFQTHGPQGASQVDQKERQKPFPTISLLDFKVAMELNPQQLGEDWPLQLEKISFQSFDQ